MKRSPSASRLARWFGDEHLEDLSHAMRGWYGPPITLGLSPSRVPVLAHGDGDFSGGSLLAGGVSGLLDHVDALSRVALRSVPLSTGFTGLADVIFRYATNRRRSYCFNKSAVSAVIGGALTMWYDSGFPTNGNPAAAAPGGTVPTSATAGAIAFQNAPTGEAAFFSGGMITPIGVQGGPVLLYDRLFSVAKTMNSTATEAVTGVPTRYQNTTAGAVDSAEGNFLITEVVTTLAATAHNWTVCQYTNQAGTAGRTAPSAAGVSSQSARRLDLATSRWFMELQAGDTGIQALTQMQCDALVATGAIDFTIGHPIGWLPTYLVGGHHKIDGVRRPFQLGGRIFDDACLSFLEITKPVANNTTWSGSFDVVYG